MPFPYTQQTWTDGVSQASAARLGVIEAGIALAGVFGTGSSPPGSPTDGMLWRCPADTSNGVYWLFQYDSSQTTYKWVFIGGPPMYSFVDATQSTASTSYVVLATGGPDIVVPRAGDYMITIGSRPQLSAVPANTFHSYTVGAVAAQDADGISADHYNANQSKPGLTKTRRKTGVVASASISSRYRVDAATGAWGERWMSILPIRVI